MVERFILKIFAWTLWYTTFNPTNEVAAEEISVTFSQRQYIRQSKLTNVSMLVQTGNRTDECEGQGVRADFRSYFFYSNKNIFRKETLMSNR